MLGKTFFLAYSAGNVRREEMGNPSPRKEAEVVAETRATGTGHNFSTTCRRVSETGNLCEIVAVDALTGEVLRDKKGEIREGFHAIVGEPMPKMV
ncbi:MAG: hypothetical protein ABIJ23_04725 [Candidatus Magasanikbacteria bacterium]